MKKSQLDDYGLTITQAAFFLEINPGVLAEALGAEEAPQWLKYCYSGLSSEDREDFDYFRLGAQLKETSWAATTARASIPILIEKAQKGEVITYGDLDAELRRRDPSRKEAGILTKYGKPLGIIGDVIEEIRDEAKDPSSAVPSDSSLMPPLEAIVVDGRKRLPGPGINGFLIEYLRLKGKTAPEDLMHLERDRRMAVEEIQSEVFAWSDWSVLETLARK